MRFSSGPVVRLSAGSSPSLSRLCLLSATTPSPLISLPSTPLHSTSFCRFLAPTFVNLRTTEPRFSGKRLHNKKAIANKGAMWSCLCARSNTLHMMKKNKPEFDIKLLYDFFFIESTRCDLRGSSASNKTVKQ